jgi:hypothetical protein
MSREIGELFSQRHFYDVWTKAQRSRTIDFGAFLRKRWQKFRHERKAGADEGNSSQTVPPERAAW